MHIIEDERPPIIPYLIVSILVHALLFAFLPYQVESPKWKEKVVEVVPIFERGKGYEIADIAKPAVEKRPDKAKFLGMYDSSVEKEEVAAAKRAGGNNAGTQGSKLESESVKKEPEKKDPEKMAIGKKKSLYGVDRKLFAMKTPDLKGGKNTEVGGSAALDDYYPDYKLGVHTYLNVLRYPDVEYFVRMKRQFKTTFDPAPVLRQYFSANRVTRGSIEVVLAVSVNRDGNLSELFVLNGSGVQSYDQEAMRTIRASAPFATPPDKFLEDDGLLRMSWTFTVYL